MPPPTRWRRCRRASATRWALGGVAEAVRASDIRPGDMLLVAAGETAGGRCGGRVRGQRGGPSTGDRGGRAGPNVCRADAVRRRRQSLGAASGAGAGAGQPVADWPTSRGCWRRASRRNPPTAGSRTRPPRSMCRRFMRWRRSGSSAGSSSARHRRTPPSSR